jgi:hypothetical protein
MIMLTAAAVLAPSDPVDVITVDKPVSQCLFIHGGSAIIWCRNNMATARFACRHYVLVGER